LLAKRNDRHEEEVADLHGARFVTTVEAAEGRYWDEARVKWLTGGDRITARHMYASRFSFAPTHKLWIAANHKPHARGTDLGFWRRVHLVPFTVTIAEGEVDHDLRAKLERELPGILRWAVEGAVAWREMGLKPPRAVRAATDEYRSREDVVGAFIADCCVLYPQARVTTQALYAAYEAWAEANGERPMSKIDLGNALEERPGITRHRSKSNRGLAGIGLCPKGDEGDDSGPFSPSSTHARARKEELSKRGLESSPSSPAPIEGCRCAGDFCAGHLPLAENSEETAEVA
jgi:putative DNA primase/helicase